MHLFGYSATSHELYLPLMYGSVSDVLMTPKKVKPNAKFLKEASVRIQVVHAVIEALLNGIINLHENGVAHRDIKLENLLLDVDPRDQRFGVSSVKISDLGFSLDISDANPINPEARDELPGTPPHTAPEVLQARVDRKKMVQALITYAMREGLGNNTRLRDLKVRNASKDKDKKIGDWAAMSKLEELVGSDVAKSAEFQAAAQEPRDAYENSLAIVQAAPEKLDVFSAAMTAWMLLNPDVPEPDADVAHDASDKQRLKRLKEAGRPSLKVQKDTIDGELFAKLGAAKFFEDGWRTDPTKRFSAKTMLGRLEAAMRPAMA